jgi:hypothetical protein
LVFCGLAVENLLILSCTTRNPLAEQDFQHRVTPAAIPLLPVDFLHVSRETLPARPSVRTS